MDKHLVASVHTAKDIVRGRAAQPGRALRGLLLIALILSLIGLTHPTTIAAAGPDIVVNGGFEQPAIRNGNFQQLTTIPGWALSAGTAIEVQNHAAGAPFEGNQFVELDSNASSGIYQNLATVAGATYFLQFAFSPRPGTAATDNRLEVLWGGTSLGIIEGGAGGAQTAWKTYNFALVATGATTRLDFRDRGISNSLGTYLDAVSVRANDAPVADAHGPYHVNEGATLVLQGTATDPEPGTGLSYAWDLDNNGTFETPGQTPTFSAVGLDGPSSQIVRLQVCDGYGACGAPVSATVFIDNVAPQASVSNNGPVSIDEAQTLAFSLSNPTDPSPADTAAGFHYAFACDGTLDGATYAGSGATAATTCTYPDGPSGHTLRARIIDKDGGFTEYLLTVSVLNVAPTATFSASSPVAEGSTSQLALANASDPSPDDVAAGLHYAFTCEATLLGDGTYLGGATYASTAGNAATTTCGYPDGPSDHTVAARIIDKDGGFTEYATVVHVNNVDPVVTSVQASAATINEGDSITLMGTFSDPGTADSFTLTVSWGDGTTPDSVPLAAGATSFTLGHQYRDDNPTNTPADANTIVVTITDKDGGSGMGDTTVTVNNLPPSLTITGPAAGTLYPVNTTVSLATTITDAGVEDTETCRVVWDDGSLPETTPASCPTSHTFTTAGVYTIQVTATDDDTGSDTQSVMIIVYDPSAGFVTGGGWINSPAGAYQADPTLTGKATFGFVSKYQKGATVPTGQTEFQFQAGTFAFHSDAYQWLVISGAKAQYKGTGSVNGVSGYGFLLTATDGDQQGGGGVDKFRIKIWDTASNTVVYDNNYGGSDDIDTANPQALGGGSIVIHK